MYHKLFVESDYEFDEIIVVAVIVVVPCVLYDAKEKGDERGSE